MGVKNLVIERALISVYNKLGLENLIETLGEYNVEITSSGGTARRIMELGYQNLKKVVDYTGFPESPGGLLKTLHPMVHGGLLLSLEKPEHRDYMRCHGIKPFDMVVVNLYPFEKIVKGGADLERAAEYIDIGGPTMIRSAAKASLLYDKIAVITDPSQYRETIEVLKFNNGEFTTSFRKKMAYKAFKRTAEYESAISSFFEEKVVG